MVAVILIVPGILLISTAPTLPKLLKISFRCPTVTFLESLSSSSTTLCCFSLEDDELLEEFELASLLELEADYRGIISTNLS